MLGWSNHATDLRWRSSETETQWVLVSLGSDFTCWCGLQTINQFLNCVDRPSKTRLMINNVRHVFFANIAVMFAACLVQEEMIKNRLFCVCKQKKKHVPTGGKRHHTNQSQNYMAKQVIWLLRKRQKFREGQQWKSDSNSDGDRDSKFWELRDLWHLACLECIVSVVCSVWCSVFSVLWSLFLWVKTMRRMLNVEQAGRSWGRPEPEALPVFKCK